MERIQLELHGVADGAEAHGIAQLAACDHFQLAAAHKALAVRHGESGGQLETALAAPGVAHLRAADFVFVENAVALRTGGWHVNEPPPAPVSAGRGSARPMYSSIPCAARRPAPIARITVAAPVTISPPANTPGNRGHAGALVHLDVSPLIGLQARRGLGDDRVGGGAQRVDHGVHIQQEFRPGDGHRRAPAGSIRLAQLHLLAAHAGDPARPNCPGFPPARSATGSRCPLRWRAPAPPRAPAIRGASAGKRTSRFPRPCAARRAAHPWPCCRRPPPPRACPCPTGVS